MPKHGGFDEPQNHPVDAIAQHIPENTEKKLAVLISTGSFSPVHKM
jgi:hypothetical protein